MPIHSNRSALRLIAGVAFLLAALFAADGARATVPIGGTVALSFTGDCGDCTGQGTATLVLNNYVIGASVLTSNFGSLSYSSSLISFNTTNAAAIQFISGSFNSALPGPQDFTVAFNAAENYFQMYSVASTGNWCVGSNCLADYGTNNVWRQTSAVPEPASMMLLGSCVAGFVAVRRRRSA